MTHTLEALKSGTLIGTKRLKLACGLINFPEEILTLADSLEILDLSDNKLNELPDSIVQLKHLKIIFFARNNFTVFPKILSSCISLSMIGFKSNQIHTVPENAFPPKLQWLILTENKIKKIPNSIGDSHLLQKCMLSGNFLEELPSQMKHCTNLELLRISVNKLKAIPTWLFQLPKLSWIAFGGNPFGEKSELSADLQSFDWSHFNLLEQLGEGASGLISKALWISRKENIALKVFKGEVTSDGLPEDEMNASILAGKHDNLIPILGNITNHPQGKSGLIMKLIPPTYTNLGNPPSLETCTRDVFDATSIFNSEQLLKIAKSIASVSAQLHSKGINHGDLYAHNILVTKTADSLLGDFGAASFYDINSIHAQNIERTEVRAYACLIEDVLNLVPIHKINNALKNKWQNLIHTSKNPNVSLRPNFIEISRELNNF